MPDNNKVTTNRVVLDLAGDGTASFTTEFRADVVNVGFTGVDAGTEAVVNVGGTDVATVALTDGEGSAATSAVSRASDVSAQNVNAQIGGNTQGYVRQANATSVGYGNFTGPSVPNQAPVADNVPAGTAVTVTVTGATAGTAVVTLDKAGTAVGVNPNTDTDSTY